MIKKLMVFSTSLLMLIALLSSCDRRNTISLPGYIEGKYTYIAPLVSGKLKNLFVNAGDKVSIDQPLFSLEEYPEAHNVLAATARVEEASQLKKKSYANYLLQKDEYERKLELYKQGVISKDQLEIEKTQYQQASMELQAADKNTNALLANQQKAEWESQQKITKSPVAALVFDTYYTPGEFISNGTPVVSLLSPEQIKIIFFVSEARLSQLQLNQSIEVLIDGYPTPIQAHITYISDQAQYAPPIIYSNDERQRLVYRIEGVPNTKLDTPELHPGQPVTVNLINKTRMQRHK